MFDKAMSTAVIVISFLAIPILGSPVVFPRANPVVLSNLAIPSSTLPAPDGLVLKFVALGIGTQNYTCASPSSSAVPASNGALATLYDIGTKLNSDPGSAWKIPITSGLALSLSPYPAILNGFLVSQGYNNVLGEHFFTSAMVPTFSLFDVPSTPIPQVNCKKSASMPAPTSACPGENNEGAVPWLYLTDAGGSTGGVNTVYRLETAGGSAPATCESSASSFTVRYAAQYWIYGPPS
ncbi:hypothetical protein K432DRAFT_328920 [Lepidopterella palustris CBS 459.81]|uniref:Malate dehydrogenase n=1 Tax=Lepidopterella palustris CBS 459.81 TaxID=1314670 RepID=A0A8E2E9R7_9PEZI|nr:hypothetical protein K432DRAFT_328920 [Lepidopterella palustris CBS 459.81]